MKAEAKHAKKQSVVDDNRRATYKHFRPSAFGHESSVLTTLSGDVKQLMKVCMYHEEVIMLLRVLTWLMELLRAKSQQSISSSISAQRSLVIRKSISNN